MTRILILSQVEPQSGIWAVTSPAGGRELVCKPLLARSRFRTWVDIHHRLPCDTLEKSKKGFKAFTHATKGRPGFQPTATDQ